MSAPASALTSTTQARHRVPTAGPAGPASAAGSKQSRLMLIVESAPVSLVVIAPDGKVLAANRSTLAMFGAASPAGVAGTRFTDVVAPDDRSAVDACVRDVCHGESRTIEFRLAGPDSHIVEMRAIALARDGASPAMLAAMWDVTERPASGGLGTATVGDVAEQANRLVELQQALDEANRTLATRDAERDALVGATRTMRHQLRDELAKQETLRDELTARWSVERDALAAVARDAEAREADLIARLTTVTEEAARSGELLEDARSQREYAQETIQMLEQQCEALSTASRSAEEQFEAVLRDDRAQIEALTEERERWRAAFVEVAALLSGARATIAQVVAPPDGVDQVEDGVANETAPVEPSAWEL